MINISVSNDNYIELINAQNGEEINIFHKSINRGTVVLKKMNVIPPTVRMTISEIEKALGHRVEIIDRK